MSLFLQKQVLQDIGIGLESVTGIIEKNGGTIDIYPKENTFSVGINIPY